MKRAVLGRLKAVSDLGLGTRWVLGIVDTDRLSTGLELMSNNRDSLGAPRC